MKKVFVFLVALLCSTYLFSQDEIVTVEKNTDLTKTIDQRQYLFPEFKDGRVVYKNGGAANGKLNYNMLSNTVQFMQGKEVLNIANENDVLLVVIGGQTLIKLKKGFAAVLAQAGTMQLAVKKSISTRTPPKEGAYGVRSETTSIDNVSYVQGAVGNLIVLPVEVQLENKITFYILNENKEQVADKKGFLKSFSKNKKEIEQYIKDNAIDFADENQLKQLFTYCAAL